MREEIAASEMGRYVDFKSYIDRDVWKYIEENFKGIVFMHYMTKVIDVPKPYISIYTGIDYHVGDCLYRTIDVDSKASDICLDMKYPVRGKVLVRMVDRNRNILAVIDSTKNLYCCDLPHKNQSEAARIFEKIIRTYEDIMTMSSNDGVAIKSIVDEVASLTTHYRVTIKPVFRPRVEDIKKIVEMKIEQMKGLLDMRVKIKEGEVEDLKRDIIEIRESAFVKAFETIAALTMHPKVKKFELKDGKIHIFPNIEVKWAILKGKVYDISHSSGRFYVNELEMRPDATIYEVYSPDAFHPNVSKTGTVCLGTIEGQSLSKIPELLEMLEHVNLDSCFDNEASELAFEIVDKMKEDGHSGEESNEWIV